MQPDWKPVFVRGLAQSPDFEVTYEMIVDGVRSISHTFVPADSINPILAEMGLPLLQPVDAEAEALRRLIDRRRQMVCSPLQGRLVLGEAVCTALDTLAADPTTPWAMRQTIEKSIEWRRLSPTIDELGWLLGFTDEQMDSLFEVAMTLHT